MFKRVNGDTCKMYDLVGEDICDGDDINVDDYPGIKYGDIVHGPDEYRAVDVYIYNGCSFEGISGSELVGNGDGAIDVHISKYIENPLTFFTDEIIEGADICYIDLDTHIHMPMLRKLAGDRDIYDGFKFLCECFDCERRVMFESAPLYNGKTMELQLTPKLHDCYLTGKPVTEKDPISIKKHNKRKIKHEEFIKSLEVGKYYIYNIYNNGKPIGGGSLDLKRIERLNNIPTKLVLYSEYGLGIVGINGKQQTMFEFKPFEDRDSGVPVWKCTDLNISSDCKMFKYNEVEKKYNVELILY